MKDPLKERVIDLKKVNAKRRKIKRLRFLKLIRKILKW